MYREEQQKSLFLEVIKELESTNGYLSPEQGDRTLRRLSECLAFLERFRSFDDSHYKRNLVFRSETFELLMLCWNSGQLSSIHNHKGSLCSVLVIEGVASEMTFLLSDCGALSPHHLSEYRQGEITTSSDEDIHILGNLQKVGKKLVTLHLYSPLLAEMEIFPFSRTVFSPLLRAEVSSGNFASERPHASTL